MTLDANNDDGIFNDPFHCIIRASEDPSVFRNDECLRSRRMTAAHTMRCGDELIEYEICQRVGSMVGLWHDLLQKTLN